VRTTACLVGLAAFALLATGCGGNTRRGTATAAGASARQPPATSTEQRADNENALNNEAATLSTDFFNLRGELATLQGDVPARAQTLSGERVHVVAAQRDLELTSSTTAERICAAARVTRRDADSTQGELDTLLGERDTFVGDEQDVLFAVGALHADDDQFRHDLAVVRDYVPAGAPSAAAVATALASARAAVTRRQTLLKADLRTARQLVTQATGYATRAEAICRSRGR